jgi:hypothetical protein
VVASAAAVTLTFRTVRRTGIALAAAGLAVAAGGCADDAPTAATCALVDAPPTVLAASERRAPRVASAPSGYGIAVWESVTGGPLEAVVLGPGGEWGHVARISEPAAAEPAVAIDSTGRAVVVWDGRDDDGVRTVVVAERNAAGAWSRPRVVGTSDVGAPLRPRVAISDDGAASIAWRSDLGGAVAIARRPVGGTWGTAETVTVASRGVEAVEVALVGGGETLVWLESDGRPRRVRMARATQTGWSSPVTLSPPQGRSSEIDLVAGTDGGLLATWRLDVGERGQSIQASAKSEGDWTPAVTLSGLADRPRGIPRPPGPQTTGPRAALGRDGRAVVVWAERADGRDRARASLRRDDGTWTPPVALSGSDESGWPTASITTAGTATAVWEDLDGQRLGLRSQTSGSDGAWRSCRRLSQTGQEIASPEVAPLARGETLLVWAGSNSGSIEARILRSR